MKTLTLAACLAALPAAWAAAQSTVLSTRVLERGRSYNRVESIVQSRDGVTISTNNFLGNGLNRLDDSNGQWVAADPVLQSYPDAIAGTGGGHRVIIAKDLYSSRSIDFEGSQGTRITAHPLALALFNPETSERFWVATVTNSAAELLGPEEVIFRRAFHGLEGSIVYRYEKGRLSQEVILEEPIGLPAGWPDRARVEMVTELMDFPAPETRAHPVRGDTSLVDEEIHLGEVVLGPGKAFATEPGGKAHGPGVPALKRIVAIDGRTLLVESVPWKAIRLALGRDPVNDAGQSMEASTRVPARSEGIAKQTGFEARLASVTSHVKGTLVAMDDSGRGVPAGYTIDWNYLDDYYYSGFTFTNGQTYVLSDDVFMEGDSSNPIYFNSGAVIKFQAGTTLTISGTVYPAGNTICTAWDDNSDGDSTGSGTPSGRYAATALECYYLNPDLELSGMDIRYAETGVYIYGQVGSGHTLSSSLFYECDLGVYASECDISLYGADWCEVGTNYDHDTYGSVSGYGYTDCEADRDSDGLPDNWEYTHFHDRSQSPGGDYDGDGVSNQQEYEQGLDPTDLDSDGDGVIDQLFKVVISEPKNNSNLP
jgi:hypothetical protein